MMSPINIAIISDRTFFIVNYFGSLCSYSVTGFSDSSLKTIVLINSIKNLADRRDQKAGVKR